MTGKTELEKRSVLTKEELLQSDLDRANEDNKKLQAHLDALGGARSCYNCNIFNRDPMMECPILKIHQEWKHDYSTENFSCKDWE